MRRVLVAVLLLVAAIAWTQPADVDQIYAADTPRMISWSEVTTDSSGNPFLPGDVINYRAYVRQWPDGVAVLVADGVVVTSVTLDISALPRGYYYIGVSAYDAFDPLIPGEESGIAWSNDPSATGPTQRFCWMATATLYPADPTDFKTVP